MKDHFLVGKIVSFQGLKGEVKILLATNSPSLIAEINEVEIQLTDGKTIKTTVQDFRFAKNLLIAKFDNYSNRSAVEPLLHAQVYMPSDQLLDLEPNEWWVQDLIGLDAYTTDGILVGKVANLIDTGHHLLEIKVPESEKIISVPFVKALVPVVDLKNRRIEIVDLPGLLEPQ